MEKELNRIISTLKSNQESISFAESCTGGRVAAAFTSIAGVSSIFSGSCVTYSNEIKHLWLGVEIETLDNFGAVSRECVHEMLVGIQKKAKSDHAIAISGIAGPDGGSRYKPVGTVYIGVLSRDTSVVKKYLFKGDREAIQSSAMKESIVLFEEILQKH